MDRDAAMQLVRRGMPPFWGLVAEASPGGRFEDDGDVRAAIVPAAPERSVFNSVFFETAVALEGALERLAAAYEAAGVRAWTVWVPETDGEARRVLEDAGHRLDAAPRAMAMGLSDLREPPPAAGVEVVPSEDVERLAQINDAAYGWRGAAFAAVLLSPLPGTRNYLARLDGEVVGAGMMVDLGSDCQAAFIATLEEARGRGVAGRLMWQGLADAHQRGQATTTLQATKAGRPVYERLGYRDCGALEMWERRDGGS